jgi:hypothetical protein
MRVAHALEAAKVYSSATSCASVRIRPSCAAFASKAFSLQWRAVDAEGEVLDVLV